jgi:prepilin-type N-terminal cleavage/methylation domain-containing protein
VNTRPFAPRSGGFTLAELMLSLAIGAVVCAVSMTGIVFLQKSYAATEQYALSMSDQMRVLDYLSMDLRRATDVQIDNLNKSLILTLPAYYAYDPIDTTHRNPLPVPPAVEDDSQHAVYTPGKGAQTPCVWYRFDPQTNQFQRREYFTDGNDTGWQTVASQLNGFPVITPDPVNPLKYTVTISFTPAFQTLDTPVSNVITLSSTVYLRNE